MWLQTVCEDYSRHGSTFKDPGVWLLLGYRLSARAAEMPRGPWRAFAVAATGGLRFAIQLGTRSALPPDLVVGSGFHLIHAMNVYVAPGTRIGDRVGIMHEVTIGLSSERPGAPTIGNDVFVGPGATILGPIVVGDGATIAANSLVVSDVPAGAFVIGVPAKIVRWGISNPAPAMSRDAAGATQLPHRAAAGTAPEPAPG